MLKQKYKLEKSIYFNGIFFIPLVIWHDGQITLARGSWFGHLWFMHS